MPLEEIPLDRFSPRVKSEVLAGLAITASQPNPQARGSRSRDPSLGEGRVGQRFPQLGGVVGVVVEKEFLEARESSAGHVAIEV